MAEIERFLTVFPELQEGEFFEIECQIRTKPARRDFYPSIPSLKIVLDRMRYRRYPELNRQGWEIYIGACTRLGEDSDSPVPSRVGFLWIDLDTRNKPGDFHRIKSFDPSPTMIVDSGNGLHGYWKLSEPVPAMRDGKQREDVVQVLKAMAEEFGANPEAADLIRRLRVPGFKNNKNHKRVQVVRVISCEPFRAYRYADLARRFLPEGTEIPETEAAVATATNTGAPPPPPALAALAPGELVGGPDELERVIRGCAFISWCRDNQKRQAEPHWRAMASVLLRFKGGKVAIHDFSKKRAEYDKEIYEHQLNTIKDLETPAPCQRIYGHGLGPADKLGLRQDEEGKTIDDFPCDHCHWKGKIYSPIEIPTAEAGKTMMVQAQADKAKAKAKEEAEKKEESKEPDPGESGVLPAAEPLAAGPADSSAPTVALPRRVDLLDSLDPVQLQKEFKRTYREGIATGIEPLDKILAGNGLVAGRVYAVVGYPGCGKTFFCTFLTDCLTGLANPPGTGQGVPVFYASTEETRAAILSRSWARLAGILGLPGSDFATGAPTDQHLEQVCTEHRRRVGKRLWLMEARPNHTVATLAETAEAVVQMTGERPVIFLDNLQGLSGAGGAQPGVGRDVRNIALLRQLARHYRVPVLCVSSRPVVDPEGNVELEGDGAEVAFAADAVIGIYPKESEANKRGEVVTTFGLRVPKNRGGEADEATLSFSGESGLLI